ncbi:MAG: thiamine diphosphokinase [Rubellimicrobium sp.]|nr:thiamine diphosphokinase [Rubellimicrobium sp.]
MIVHASAPVTLVGGGPLGAGDLEAARALAPVLVALDRGADHLLAAGLRPEAVIGDLDSLSDASRAAFGDRLIAVAEQVTTDFDKGLRHVAAPLILGVGLSGGRLDHELAALSGLVARPDRACLILGAETVTFLCPPQLDLDLPGDSALSLFPMAPVAVDSCGLVWPTDGIAFRPGGRIGTSNRVAEGPVRLWADCPAMLVIVPRAGLGPAAAALRAAPRWAAPPPEAPPDDGPGPRGG